MGTGKLNYPKDLVAKHMYIAVKQFASQNPTSGITEVQFVLYNKDYGTVKVAFKKFRTDYVVLFSIVFLSSFVFTGLDFFMSNLAVVSRKSEGTYPIFTGVGVAHLLLLLYMYCFSCLIFFVVFISVFHVWSLS